MSQKEEHSKEQNIASKVDVYRLLFSSILTACLFLAGCTGCFSNNPEELKERTAQATSQIKQDARAVAQGVHEGWTRDHPLDLNHATKEQLLSLPGFSTERANRVIETRPFDNTHQLVSRRILPQSEYDRIKDQLTVKP